MIIRTADFVVSNTDPSKCPDPVKPEFAFIGRSNVGKSSLINLLVQRKNLAKTSSTPGKTQLINHFLVNGSWYVVDLPGYGYANVNKDKRSTFGGMIETYLKKRTSLITTFVLLDPRLEPQKIDLEFIQWMGESGLPFSLVFTKSDKLTHNHLVDARKQWEKKLSESWEELPPFFFTSATERKGQEELLAYIDAVMKKQAEE
jgi:GTP-binding protein